MPFLLSALVPLIASQAALPDLTLDQLRYRATQASTDIVVRNAPVAPIAAQSFQSQFAFVNVADYYLRFLDFHTYIGGSGQDRGRRLVITGQNYERYGNSFQREDNAQFVLQNASRGGHKLLTLQRTTATQTVFVTLSQPVGERSTSVIVQILGRK
jgi:hypothetical protein